MVEVVQEGPPGADHCDTYEEGEQARPKGQPAGPEFTAWTPEEVVEMEQFQLATTGATKEFVERFLEFDEKNGYVAREEQEETPGWVSWRTAVEKRSKIGEKLMDLEMGQHALILKQQERLFKIISGEGAGDDSGEEWEPQEETGVELAEANLPVVALPSVEEGEKPSVYLRRCMADLWAENEDGERVRDNVTRGQLEFVAHVARVLDALRAAKDSGAPVEDYPHEVMILLGQGGTGKTWVINRIVREAINNLFPTGLRGKEATAAVAFSHAQAQGIGGLTLHSQAKINVATDISVEGLQPTVAQQEFLNDTWGHVVALIIEEISMIPARLLWALSVRVCHGRQALSACEPDLAHIIDHMFGKIPIVFLLGDFLQLKPTGALSLADDLKLIKKKNKEAREEALKKRKRTGELRTKDKVHVTKAVEDAHKLFDAIPHVFELHNTKRFKPADGPLPQILAHMRRIDPGPLPDDLWEALAGRLCEEGDPRFATDNFQLGNSIAIYW